MNAQKVLKLLFSTFPRISNELTPINDFGDFVQHVGEKSYLCTSGPETTTFWYVKAMDGGRFYQVVREYLFICGRETGIITYNFETASDVVAFLSREIIG